MGRLHELLVAIALEAIWPQDARRRARELATAYAVAADADPNNQWGAEGLYGYLAHRLGRTPWSRIAPSLLAQTAAQAWDRAVACVVWARTE